MAKSAKEKELKESVLGPYLAKLRTIKGITLREVEEATSKTVSNAYLSQLENGYIGKPSPNILHSLAEVYGVPYENLMEKAGYLISGQERDDSEKHGRAATLAGEPLTKDEEDELLNYLAFMRTKKGKENKA